MNIHIHLSPETCGNPESLAAVLAALAQHCPQVTPQGARAPDGKGPQETRFLALTGQKRMRTPTDMEGLPREEVANRLMALVNSGDYKKAAMEHAQQDEPPPIARADLAADVAPDSMGEDDY